jgi:meiotically up-regulated gene 157 (Mug157) protein
MHESFDPNFPDNFSRPHFAWANSLFAELVRDKLSLLLDEPTTHK